MERILPIYKMKNALERLVNRMDGKRYLMSEIREMYPDKWVILEDCEWENKSTVKSAIIVEICDDSEISQKRMKYRHEGKKYIYERTTESFVLPYVHAVNYEVKV